MTALKLAIGMAIVFATAGSMTATFVMPRGNSWGLRVSIVVSRTVRLVAVAITRPIRSFERKDTVLAMVAPVALLGQLVVFLGLFLVGYAIALWPYTTSFAVATKLAASQLFTVGLADTGGPGNSTLEDLGRRHWCHRDCSPDRLPARDLPGVQQARGARDLDGEPGGVAGADLNYSSAISWWRASMPCLPSTETGRCGRRTSPRAT